MSTPFQIVTWNVNSIRARLDHLINWLNNHGPDVICLQETKVVDELFPLEEIQEVGYEVHFAGQKSYNGVAILSKHKIEEPWIGFDGDNGDDQKRIIGVTVQDIQIVNVYVPQGSEVTSDKFQYKLEFLKKLDELIRKKFTPDQPIAVVGDINIAPGDGDVVDPVAMAGEVSFHPLEHEALGKIMDFGFSDLFRVFSSEPGQFSWWDYRHGSFRRNKGMRIDLMMVSDALKHCATGCWMDKEERTREKPSDHAPVVGEFSWPG